MKKILLLLGLTTTYSTAQCQLDKGVWLAGGSGSFYSYNQKFNSQYYNSDIEYKEIDLSISIGYFIQILK